MAYLLTRKYLKWDNFYNAFIKFGDIFLQVSLSSQARELTQPNYISLLGLP